MNDTGEGRYSACFSAAEPAKRVALPTQQGPEPGPTKIRRTDGLPSMPDNSYDSGSQLESTLPAHTDTANFLCGAGNNSAKRTEKPAVKAETSQKDASGKHYESPFSI